MRQYTHLAYYKGRRTDNPEAQLLDQVISAVTGSPYSHVELVYKLIGVAPVGLTWSSSPRDGGVRRTAINFGTGHWEVYRIATHKSPLQISGWFQQHNGKKYDWLGAVGLQVPFVKEDPKRWFCSEIIGACLRVPRPCCLSPGDLYEFYDKRGHVRVL